MNTWMQKSRQTRTHRPPQGSSMRRVGGGGIRNRIYLIPQRLSCGGVVASISKTTKQAQEKVIGFADKRQQKSWLQVGPVISRMYDAVKP